MKDLIKYVIKTLCNTRRYDLLLQKFNEGEQAIANLGSRKRDKFNIFEYLKY